jgi:cyclophilin family peptidyl-prolyl cis-trans isomerase/HEAT repeat protein
VRVRAILTALVVSAAAVASGQPVVSTRLAILTAEDRRAPTPQDLAVIRGGLHASDPETVRIAIRALGRLERPELLSEILPLLKSPLPEIRAEAANAIGQAVQGSKQQAAAKSPAVRAAGAARLPYAGASVDSAAAAMIARLRAEAEPGVRAALCQTIGRLPYAAPEQVQRAESALVDALAREESVDGRLGIAQGLEGLIRLHRRSSPPSARALSALEDLAGRAPADGAIRLKPDGAPARAARVTRIALEALITAGAVQQDAILRAAADPDAQVRRLAMRAAAGPTRAGADTDAEVLRRGITDASPLVRLEALRGLQAREGGPEACAVAVAAASDPNEHVALQALDQLASCSLSPDALALLVRTVDDVSTLSSSRGWHRSAHALVALAAASREGALAALPRFAGSRLWPVRLYAARAAATLGDRPALEKLAADDNDNVCEAAIAGLSKVAGRDANPIYVGALGRTGYQVVREAARSLAAGSSPADDAVPALKAALQRLTTEGHDNSRDARIAIVEALDVLGVHVARPTPARQTPIASQVTAADLHWLASARARVAIRDVGTFELALFTVQAPATVVRFAHLAESGYYNGLLFHRVVPNFVIQGGSPGANEYIGDASFMRDELGLWPHVRGAVGISTRGRDTGDAQIFIDLVDNPRLDHDYTVFAQVLSGMEVVDAILEGDVIEKIDIIP